MSMQLRPGLVHAICQDDIILLDLEQDRYFAVPRVLHGSFLRVVAAGEQNAADLAALADLLGPAGLQPGSPQADSRTDRPQAVEGKLPCQQQSAGGALFARALLLRAYAIAWLRIAPLDRVIGRLEARKRNLKKSRTDQVKAGLVAQAFARTGPFFPTDDRCLSISTALMMAMLDRDIPATLVIGVRTAPFSAHCWVQLDGLLVNDDLETARSFSPILAV
ncbi:lasso peptide biosynthesis B2 protein [Sphingobium sp. AR-3-1]|uniref:Lasso peptide biosynthesis B2 protein n=1 Tax=Sphingobium psychrophilum TaxID=2728834 RepID=A0A7X9WYF8_9SPHN|nr:lasso peptide biosynthesis B2 protein [Sphingobium psychrophilum]NML12184.1 lasso peptide biosynthesis B2 protein [Sphingobium psychrophilum]